MKLWFICCSSASAMKNTPLKLSYVYQCTCCDSFHLQPLGRTVSKVFVYLVVCVMLSSASAYMGTMCPSIRYNNLETWVFSLCWRHYLWQYSVCAGMLPQMSIISSCCFMYCLSALNLVPNPNYPDNIGAKKKKIISIKQQIKCTPMRLTFFSPPRGIPTISEG